MPGTIFSLSNLLPQPTQYVCVCACVCVCVCKCACVCVCACGCCSAIVRIFWISSVLFETHSPHGDHREVVFLKRSAALCHVWSSVNVKPHTPCYCLYLASQIGLALHIHWHLFFTDDTISEYWPLFMANHEFTFVSFIHSVLWTNSESLLKIHLWGRPRNMLTDIRS